MQLLFSLIWFTLLFIGMVYIVRVLLLARYVHKKMNGQLNVWGFIGDVIVSTLSLSGIYAIVSGSVTRKIKNKSKE